MTTKLFPLISAALLAGCSSQPSSTSRTTTTPPGKVGDISNPEAETPPFIGMTKAQALARYGHPKKNTITDEGEQWAYVLNFGEVIGKAMIPFNFHQPAIRTGSALIPRRKFE